MIFFEALDPGTRLTFEAVTLPRQAIIAFASDYDPQPFHLDDAAAAQTHFGRLAASGWHTASATLSRLAERGAQGLALAGISEIRDLRWRAPVYPDEALRVAAEVLAAEPLDSTLGAVEFAVTVADDQDRTRFSMRCMLRIRRGG